MIITSHSTVKPVLSSHPRDREKAIGCLLTGGCLIQVEFIVNYHFGNKNTGCLIHSLSIVE